MLILRNGKFVMSLVMLGIFVVMVLMSLAYPPDSRLLPLVIGLPGIALALVQVVLEIMAFRAALSSPGGASAGGGPGRRSASSPSASGDGELDSTVPIRREVVLFGYLAGLMVTLLLLGFWISIPVFMVTYLRFYERFSWKKIAVMTIACWGALYLVFELSLGIYPHQGFLVEYFSE